MSYIRICKSHILKIVSLLSVQLSLKWTVKKNSGMDFSKHKCVFFPEVAWFLEMSYVESKKERDSIETLPKLQSCVIILNVIYLIVLRSLTFKNHASYI